MKCVFTILVLLLTLNVYSETPSFIPRVNNTGSIGTIDKQWGTGYFSRVYFDGEDISNYVSSVKLTSFNGSTGDVQIVGGDGVSVTETNGVVTVSLVDPDAIPSVGTNRIYFRCTGYTNYWTVPEDITKISVWMWGGAGGEADADTNPCGAPSGFTFFSMNVTPLDILTVVTGCGGGSEAGDSDNSTLTITEGGFPNGGIGVGNGLYVGGGGGGSSSIWYSNTLVAVAGGGGGGGEQFGGQRGEGGNGGGLSGADGNGGSGGFGGGRGTQTEGGSTYDSSSLTLLWTNTPGSYLLGGDGGIQVSAAYAIIGAGGGGGYYGGGGGFATSANSRQGGGGGGSGYINESMVLAGFLTLRSPSRTSVVGSELPEYIAGVGLPINTTSAGRGNTDGRTGLIVIGY